MPNWTKDSALAIAALTVYVYALTTLTELGANYYFSIPASYVEVSLRANTVFLYSALVIPVFQQILEQKGWILIAVAAVIFIAIWFRKEIMTEPFPSYLKGVITLTAIVLLILAPFVGNHAASTAMTFLIPEKGCPSIPLNSNYVIPVIYDGAGVMAEYRIASTGKVLTGKLFVKDLSDLNCNLDYGYNIGPLTH